MTLNPLHLIDFYKADHVSQYPDNTHYVFENWTGRGSRIEGVNHSIQFGLNYLFKKVLMETWDHGFFFKPKNQVVDKYLRRMKNAGLNVGADHIADLWELGYLPIAIAALPEGTRVPIGVPSWVIWNTHPDHAWLPGFLETQISNTLWQAQTSATIADRFRSLFDKAIRDTGGDESFTQWMGHDFSFRGMSSIESGLVSGAAHLLSFTGTDTVGAIDFLEQYYGANSDFELIGGSVPATEHSTMCMGTKEGEFETYKRLITEVYPSGPVSIVSDTWDYWKILTETLPSLKGEIMAREGGPVVVRPDTGDPALIIAGDPDAKPGSPEHRGTFEILWDTFGGSFTDKSFKQLDPHVNTIYGDSITYDKADEIIHRLMAKGFVPSMVYGIGSYTYQYNTRDTFGYAIKATWGLVDGEPREIFKDPKTGNGFKKSAKGLLAVNYNAEGELELEQGVKNLNEVLDSEFELVFEDGSIVKQYSLGEIRERLASTRKQ